MGLVEAIIARHYLLKADTVVRHGDKVTMYIVALLFAWIAAMIAGNVLHETLGAAW